MGLTGAVALGAYLVTYAGVEKLAKHIAQKTNHLIELPKMKSTLSLISVSLTALFVIPAICNAATKPLMNAFLKDNETKRISQKPVRQVNFNGYSPIYRSRSFDGMRIGGI